MARISNHSHESSLDVITHPCPYMLVGGLAKLLLKLGHGHDVHCLTHWGRVTHICLVKLTTIGSNNGLSPGRRQAIIWTNAGILLIRPLGTHFSEILIEIYTFWFKKMHLKMWSGKRWPSCLGLNVLMWIQLLIHAINKRGPSLKHRRCPSLLSCSLISVVGFGDVEGSYIFMIASNGKLILL